MRGKITLAVGASALAITGCLTNVDPRASSGKDFHPKDAKPIEIENGEGRSKRDIVTYPGGDRVDWKVFEIPEGARGRLRVKLKFRPPRPGADVAFNLYDGYFGRVARVKPSKDGKRTKKVQVDGARPGKYYLQIYAPRRDDAGTYQVTVQWKESKVAQSTGGDEPIGEIPDPPTLPAVPEPQPETPEDGKDDGNGQPQPQPCPNDPTRMQPDCEEVAAKPVSGRIVNYKVSAAGGVMVYIDRGKRVGVAKGWKGEVLDSAGNPVEGGSFKVTRVTSRESRGKVRLSVDQVKANRRVRLSPDG